LRRDRKGEADDARQPIIEGAWPRTRTGRDQLGTSVTLTLASRHRFWLFAKEGLQNPVR
jgi:hypothetical protein